MSPPGINDNKWTLAFRTCWYFLNVRQVSNLFLFYDNAPMQWLMQIIGVTGRWCYWWVAINVRLWASLKIHAHRNNLLNCLFTTFFYNIHKDINKGLFLSSQHVLNLDRNWCHQKINPSSSDAAAMPFHY